MQAVRQERGRAGDDFVSGSQGAPVPAWGAPPGDRFGATGVVRRDPFAMLPFCGYNMSDYFAHWLEMGHRLAAGGAKVPKIFYVNWFRRGPDGKFAWPGFGENMRVLQWMLARIDGLPGGVEHAGGVSPRFQDLNWAGSNFSEAQFEQVIATDAASWRAELQLHAELFAKLHHHLPAALTEVKAQLEKRLAA